MNEDPPLAQDLGFRLERRVNGDVVIHRQGQQVSILRGQAARAFLAKMANGDDAEAQQLMARVTGNYKRGNESLASRHARNRKP